MGTEDAPSEPSASDRAGAPVGRRTILGLVGLGAAGVVGGSRVQDLLGRWLGPLEANDPTGLLALFPLGDTFRFYSVTGSVRTETAATYRLSVSGEVAHAATYTLADLQTMPQTHFVKEFQCVTGWRVPDVQWGGVQLSELITRARTSTRAKAVRFRSFDGTYTESLTMAEAMRSDVIVALQMLGKPVTHDHGGPVRMYCASMYGYKSTKWLSAIELTDTEIPGYWETRGYDINGSIG
ncbi:molybdopterin-dependent oxidoreductase [Jatrophihabitans sp.]|uniref:molybdopterin-dependent oxidoreductase n=1 Tax=Jatrophihabitans sp. TaxID=1932789 RepID=UPI0030C76E7C|nr:Oxidoreductase molybdopterin binding [Jatrophihabitans sp.]